MSYSSRCASPESVASSILAPSTDFCDTADTIYRDPVKSHPRHNRYYFSDGNVIFLVEGTLYNIHRYFFHRDSSTFAFMFSLPFGGRGEGLTDDEPIVFNKIKARDFDLFLSILYPAEFGLYAATTVDEWTAILDLAAKWNFRSIKTLAIKQLTPIASPIDKIVWGRKHQINEWLGGAYQSICARADPLTYEEGMRLGMEDVIKISAIRHDNGSRTRGRPLPWTGPWLSNEELQKHFGLDIGVLPPSLDERNSEANGAWLIAPCDDDSYITQETCPSSQPACSPSGSLTEAAANNVNAAQCEPLEKSSQIKPPAPMTVQKEKKKQQKGNRKQADSRHEQSEDEKVPASPEKTGSKQEQFEGEKVPETLETLEKATD
ncbi:hypothetical protein PILCRDRAFT_816574 [Piloderma croceum F 1598]|uniref:BTB domain-containing protein n=1 Tax=Piloderma croceum (strain F 1598) TaxID=765440 RepID=A0A0C3C8J3_PILCF|nr:hypothetical protein PILCRDRAFT_816574 [Piloderma croceum F 1598]